VTLEDFIGWVVKEAHFELLVLASVCLNSLENIFLCPGTELCENIGVLKFSIKAAVLSACHMTFIPQCCFDLKKTTKKLQQIWLNRYIADILDFLFNSANTNNLAVMHIFLIFQRVFCGHEYTTANLKFAIHTEPANVDIQNKIKSAQVRDQITYYIKFF
jgi:hypothetical protein